MRFIRYLFCISVIGLAFLTITGCGHQSKEKQLYYALPINTDGNPNGRVTLVEFLDYADPTCLKMGKVIAEVMEKQPQVRIVYHPISMNAQTTYRTKLALASSLQDRFLAAHHLLLKTSAQQTEEQTIATLADALIDPKELQKTAHSQEVAAMLEKNQQLAQAWHVQQVPTFFIGQAGEEPVQLVGIHTSAQLINAIKTSGKN